MRKIFLLTVFFLLGFSAGAFSAEYVIGDEDLLQISVWGNQELSVRVPVRPDGMISVPLVGDVKAAGLTPGQLKTYLEKEYARYVKTPVVSVIMSEVNSFQVYVFGSALAGAPMGQTGPQSGMVTLRRKTTLLQFLSKLGGLIANADLRNAKIIRGNGNQLDSDMYKLLVKGDLSQDVELKPGDYIYLPDNFETRIKVIGAVKTPGLLTYNENMTVLDAVLLAGGFNEFANQGSVVIIRKFGKGEKKEVNLKRVMNGSLEENVLLKPGDIIIVKTGLF